MLRTLLLLSSLLAVLPAGAADPSPAPARAPAPTPAPVSPAETRGGYLPAPADLSAAAAADFAAALEAAKAGRASDAVVHFEASQAADPRPATLFNLGKACQEANDLENAVRYYHLYQGAAPEHAFDVDPLIAILQARLDLQRSRPAPEVAVRVPATSPHADDPTWLARIRDYRNRHLSVRSVTEFRGGGSTYDYSLGGAWVSQDPIYTVRRWGLFEGNGQIDLPRFYLLTGDQAGADELKRRIRTLRILSYGLYGIGAVGAGASIAGLVGSQGAESQAQYKQWTTVGVAGLGAMVVGFAGGSIPNARVRKLKEDPAASLSLEQARDHADAFNEKLRKEIGVSAEDALRFETDSAQ